MTTVKELIRDLDCDKVVEFLMIKIGIGNSLLSEQVRVRSDHR